MNRWRASCVHGLSNDQLRWLRHNLKRKKNTCGSVKGNTLHYRSSLLPLFRSRFLLMKKKLILLWRGSRLCSKRWYFDHLRLGLRAWVLLIFFSSGAFILSGEYGEIEGFAFVFHLEKNFVRIFGPKLSSWRVNT